MATNTFSFRQGDSYTIGIRLDASYDILGLQEIKVSLFGNTFAPNTTVDPRVFKIEISSDESAALSSSYYPLELLLDDVNFGVKKFVLAIAYATPSATASNGSINTGYDIILDVKISDTPIEITSTVITLVKGEKGDKGDKGDQGADGEVSDGDKGDVIVSGSGSNWAINPSAKNQAVTQSYLAGASLSALRLVKLNASNQLVYADSSTDATVLGLTFQAVSSGVAPITVLSGLVTDSSWSWVRGSPLYLGSNGQLSASIPLSGFIVPVGNAEAPTIVNINIMQGVQIS
jgi:hypothetical protein